jgi:hypothetical protein
MPNRHIVVVAALLAGCAAAEPSSTADSSAPICSLDTPTGSNIPVKRCRSAEDLRRESETANAARDAIDRSRSGIRGPAGL